MKTTLRMKIIVPSAAGGSTGEAPSGPRRSGSTDPKEFLAMRARQKKARQRARRVKFGLLAAGCAGMIGLALTSPRVRELVMRKQLQPVTMAVAAPAPAPAAAPMAVPAPIEAAPAEQAPAVEPVAPAEAS